MSEAHSKISVLLADDDESIRRAVAKGLRVWGCCVLECADGQAILDGLKSDTFDVAIVDLSMPKLSGWEALEVVTREAPLTRVIVFTAQPEQRVFADAVGASALVEKPVDMDVLCEWVDKLAHQDVKERVDRLCGLSDLPVVA